MQYLKFNHFGTIGDTGVPNAKGRYLSIKVFEENFLQIIRITVMLEFHYKTFFLIFAVFSKTPATSRKGDWDQLCCSRFIRAQKETCVVPYVYISPELGEIVWLTKCWKPSPRTGNIKQINWSFLQQDRDISLSSWRANQ